MIKDLSIRSYGEPNQKENDDKMHAARGLHIELHTQTLPTPLLVLNLNRRVARMPGECKPQNALRVDVQEPPLKFLGRANVAGVHRRLVAKPKYHIIQATSPVDFCRE